MIRYTIDNSARSIEHTLGLSNLALFFSLPFKPAGRRNLFLNGYIALGVERTIYQVYDPKLLKSDFLFSEMPTRDWLFGDGGYWVDRDPPSPQFKHVYLYRTCESTRTVVHFFFTNDCSSIIAAALNRVNVLEPSLLDCIPLHLFKRFVGSCVDQFGAFVLAISCGQHQAISRPAESRLGGYGTFID